MGNSSALLTHLPLAHTEGKTSSPAGKGPVPALTFTLASAWAAQEQEAEHCGQGVDSAVEGSGQG